jgi:hypothetical protein
VEEMYHKILADGFFVFSFFAIFLAMVGFLIGDIWLASTQWMLVAIFTVLVGIYVKQSADEDEKILKMKKNNKKKNSIKEVSAGKKIAIKKTRKNK